MTDPVLREAMATTLDDLASMLDRAPTALVQRLRRAHDELVDDPSSDLSDSTVRRHVRGAGRRPLGRRRCSRTTLSRREPRVPGPALEAAAIEPPPDLHLVTDRVREGWLIDGGSTDKDGRNVEVQPPIWTGSTTTSEFVVLHGRIDDGDEVEITVEQGSGPSRHTAVASGSPVVDLGRGRVFTTRDAAEAGAPKL